MSKAEPEFNFFSTSFHKSNLVITCSLIEYWRHRVWKSWPRKVNFDSILVAWCALLFVLEFRIQNCATYFFCVWHCLYCCTYVQKWMHSGYWCSYWPYSKLSLNNRLSTFLVRLLLDVCTKISYRQYLFGFFSPNFQTHIQNLKMAL